MLFRQHAAASFNPFKITKKAWSVVSGIHSHEAFCIHSHEAFCIRLHGIRTHSLLRQVWPCLFLLLCAASRMKEQNSYVNTFVVRSTFANHYWNKCAYPLFTQLRKMFLISLCSQSGDWVHTICGKFRRLSPNTAIANCRIWQNLST